MERAVLLSESFKVFSDALIRVLEDFDQGRCLPFLISSEKCNGLTVFDTGPPCPTHSMDVIVSVP